MIIGGEKRKNLVYKKKKDVLFSTVQNKMHHERKKEISDNFLN